MKIRLAVLFVLAACGGGGDTPPDAEGADAPAPDAFVPDADPHGPVTVTVRAAGQGIPGIDVVFDDADGNVVSSLQTGTNGSATEILLPGGSATIVVAPGANQFATITYLAVEPGDNLVFDFEQAPPTDVGDISVTLPGAQAGATSYAINLGCTNVQVPDPTVPFTGDIMSDCLGSDPQIDVFATALDASGTPVGYDFAKDITVAPTGTTTVALDGWQTAADPLNVTLSNVPAGITGAGLESHWRVDGIDFGGFDGGGAASAGTIVAATALPQGGFVERLQYGVFMQLGTALHALLVGYASVPNAPAHNLAQVLLPTFTSAAAADAGGRLELSYTADGSFADADAAIALAQWTDNGGADEHAAYVLAPPDAASPIQLPALPDALSAFRTSGTAVFASPLMIFLEADFVDNYRSWRRGPAFELISGNAMDMLPAGGGLIRLSINQIPQG